MKAAVPFHRGIAAKALGVLTLIVTVVSLVSGYYSLVGARALLTEQLTERGLVLARSLAVNAGYGVYTEDTITLNQLLDSVTAEPDVLFAVITSADGTDLARRSRRGGDALLVAMRDRFPAGDVEQAQAEQVGDEGFLLLSTPVKTREFVLTDQEESFLISFLDVGFSPDERLEMTREEHQILRGHVHLGLSTADIGDGMGEVTGKVAALSVVVILAGIAVSALLVRLMVRPLLRVTHVTTQVAGGNLSAKVDVRGQDELALLGHAFNQMTEALKGRDAQIRRSQERLANANKELADLNSHLEDRVAQRTMELREKSEALEKTNRELVLATERKSRFMANLAHELRTPLNSVIGFSEALRDGLLGPLPDRQLKYVNNIVTSGRHILDMSGGILDLSKIEAGTVAVRLESLDVAQALEEIVTITEPQWAARGLSLVADVADLDRDRACLADRGKFKQVLYNLVSNAIKFSPEGGVLRMSARTDGDHFELRVSDSGPGVPEHHREDVFEEFRQLSDGERAGGSGLGLSITRKLVELHGGTIWVEETPGGGATFVVRLPENPPPPPGAV
ncbi:MAG: HAMP domain-containing protein [Nitrospirae bacterium]|nr:HAMP domain-containing protein [Nitrospirota bacterium]